MVKQSVCGVNPKGAGRKGALLRDVYGDLTPKEKCTFAGWWNCEGEGDVVGVEAPLGGVAEVIFPRSPGCRGRCAGQGASGQRSGRRRGRTG